MKKIWIVLKSVQVLISLLIGIFFVTNHTLVANEAALLPGKKGPSGTVKATHFLCQKPPEYYMTKDVDLNFTEIKPGVTFPSYDHVIKDTAATLVCLEEAKGAKRNECMCWGQSYTIFVTVLFSLITAILSLCDLVSLIGSDSESARTSFLHGCASFWCSMGTGAIWFFDGIALSVFYENSWPYMYEFEGKRYKFFKVPADWQFATFLCYSFAIVMAVEGFVYLHEACKHPHPFRIPKKQEENITLNDAEA